MLNISQAMILTAVAMVLLLSWQTRAQAKLFPYQEGQFLVRADLDRADTAAHKLLEPHPASVGTLEAWGEPSTGNSGTLAMMQGYQQVGDECHTTSWHDLFKDGSQRAVLLNTCRVKRTEN